MISKKTAQSKTSKKTTLRRLPEPGNGNTDAGQNGGHLQPGAATSSAVLERRRTLQLSGRQEARTARQDKPGHRPATAAPPPAAAAGGQPERSRKPALLAGLVFCALLAILALASRRDLLSSTDLLRESPPALQAGLWAAAPAGALEDAGELEAAVADETPGAGRLKAAVRQAAAGPAAGNPIAQTAAAAQQSAAGLPGVDPGQRRRASFSERQVSGRSGGNALASAGSGPARRDGSAAHHTIVTFRDAESKTPVLKRVLVAQKARETYSPRPGYPKAAADQGTTGWVHVRFLVTASGGLDKLQVISSSPAGVFEAKVQETLAQWRFLPARDDAGKAISFWKEVRFDFQLQGGS